MSRRIFIYLCMMSALTSSVLPESTVAPTTEAPAARTEDVTGEDAEAAPEGYYAFVESPNATPPRVRPPPYRKVEVDCAAAGDSRPHVTAHNLCGDLNRGDIPKNPMGQNPDGEPYPFELIRNQTLRFLSRALPALRHDESLPRVARLPAAGPAGPAGPAAAAAAAAAQQAELDNGLEERSKRSAPGVPARLPRAVHLDLDQGRGHELDRDHEADGPRESRKFCDGGGVFCMLYRAINGDSQPAVERREDPGPRAPAAHRYEGPPTPCPARVEYATPVFARNYQGVWRYVVQIPYEGYFTQTVEVTRCMQSRCHYLEGGCLSSPRWVSLLVAELHYPAEPTPTSAQDYQQFVKDRVSEEPAHCDGHDKFGCYQVRLYYDWFLVPGSCKCWRPDYFARYVRRRHTAASADL